MRLPFLFLFAVSGSFLSAQISYQSTGGMRWQWEKMGETTRVLYLAAHPDDENTRLISAMARGNKYEVAYLSLTRGDGGQNLIGPELGDGLGIIRTHELLEARKWDGGLQYFTRAVDFGYSKSAEESLNLWGEEVILSDVVYAIRLFRPHVIITRFPPDERAGHGHHTASAMLALKALEWAGTDTAFADQLAFLTPWKPKAVYWNTSPWWDKTLEEAPSGEVVTWEVGGFDPLLGRSYNEIASFSRSSHRSQGFGMATATGNQTEYLRLLAGSPVIQAGGLIQAEPDKAEQEFLTLWKAFPIPDFTQPPTDNELAFYSSMFEVLKEHGTHMALSRKRDQLTQLVLDRLGFVAKASVSKRTYMAGEKDSIQLRVVFRNRSLPVEGIVAFNHFQAVGETPLVNQSKEWSLPYEAHGLNEKPYWLNPHPPTLYALPDPYLRCLPVSPDLERVSMTLKLHKQNIQVQVPVRYYWVDPATAEHEAPVLTVPALMGSTTQGALFVPEDAAGKVVVQLTAHEDTEGLSLVPQAPTGWMVNTLGRMPERIAKGTTVQVEFEVRPSASAVKGPLTFKLGMAGDVLQSKISIHYEHIPEVDYLTDLSVELSSAPVSVQRGKVAYLMGAGDEVDQATKALGFEVESIGVEQLAALNPKKTPVLILGIRSTNVLPQLENAQALITSYVQKGGHVVVQYVTAGRGGGNLPLAPKPLSIGRSRVSEENAIPTFLLPKHDLLNYPNKLEMSDFENWVQERGLYFAEESDAAYERIISWADANEPPRDGALLVLKHGKGTFIYTGISFFRQLPAGVPGAYRLWANILSYGR